MMICLFNPYFIFFKRIEHVKTYYVFVGAKMFRSGLLAKTITPRVCHISDGIGHTLMCVRCFVFNTLNTKYMVIFNFYNFIKL